MSRLVPAGSLARDQIDILDGGTGPDRVELVTLPDLTVKVFFNNTPLSWPLADGSLTADSGISAGTVYFNELSGEPGYYGIRFFPDNVGYWRVCIRYSVTGQEITKDYDVVPGASGRGGNGLNASFTR